MKILCRMRCVIVFHSFTLAFRSSLMRSYSVPIQLFRRIMANTNRNRKHQYKVSYSLDVGSSFDPDMEDVASWEEELTGKTLFRHFCV